MGVSKEPEEVLKAVEAKAKDMAFAERQCERGFAHLGFMLLEIAQMQYWKLRYDSFRDYLKEVAEISRKTTEQLQRYLLTVRDLSDSFNLNELETMGITKAMKLRAVKDYAIVLPSSIIKAALDPSVTAAMLKKEISTTLKVPDDDGDWMDLECEFMVTPEDRALLEQAIDAAMHTEPITKQTISKSAQMLDVMKKFAMEFLSAHTGDGN